MALLERTSNEALVDEWIALYAPDATAEWLIDGAADRYQGVGAIRPIVIELTALWRVLRLRSKALRFSGNPSPDTDRRNPMHDGGIDAGRITWTTRRAPPGPDVTFARPNTMRRSRSRST
ncbi:MAG TPA: hypothetical protein DIW80_13865 [Gordonia polyisoprenivorans]|nr:hypothetical protein [Gordonia polyisoprenivorans]